MVLISARKRSAPITAASSGSRTFIATLRSCLRSFGEVDGCHPTLTYFAFDRVPVGQRRLEVVERGGHRGTAWSACQLKIRMTGKLLTGRGGGNRMGICRKRAVTLAGTSGGKCSGRNSVRVSDAKVSSDGTPVDMCVAG